MSPLATVGVDIGGTKVRAVRMVEGSVVAEARGRTPRGALLSSDLMDPIRHVWDPDVVAVGAGVAGLVDADEGRLVWGPHLTGANVAVGDALEEEFGVPAVVANDVNAAAWGELQLGAGRGYRDFLLVTVGTGIGGAIVIGGEIYRGGSFAGEWGHMSFDPIGRDCDCGKAGCWETVVSGPALVRAAREAMASNPSGLLPEGDIDGEGVTSAAIAGDAAALEAFQRVGDSLGRGLADLIVIFDPEVVVIGGGLGSVDDLLLAPARHAAGQALVGGAHRPLPAIVTAGLGERANAIGAALLAVRRIAD